jgi:hypothetical protein
MTNTRSIKSQFRIFIGGVVVVGLLWAAVQLVFYYRTVSHLKRFHITHDGLIGPLMSSKSGCLWFAKWIGTATFTNYLANTHDVGDKELVMAILAWKARADTLEYLRTVASSENKEAGFAVFSAVAIEQAVPFPGKDFSQEYYQEYVHEAVSLSKLEKLPLKEAAVLVAKRLKAKNVNGANNRQ